MAKLALTRTALYAPFDGTITAVYADPGDPVAFGQPLINIATTQKLQVQTIDLTELNVVKLKIGQNVDVVMDALPDLVLTGHITKIGMEAVDYRGDVTYPVLIDLDDHESRLRLGMTAEVTIPIP
jgi:HlyD family secretion protein